MRLCQLDIVGQEMLTLDKVSLRISLVCNYRIKDCVKIATEIDDFKEQLHVCAQIALRQYIGRHKLDEILENKEELSAYVYERLKEKESGLFIEIPFACVKDIILPGEIREIMNTVLVAEKRAQANVITRREEVASTRSLLNTAKLMDENKTLYKLKELEYIERICENVGTLTLNGNGDILSQITGMLKGG
jgi:regulator of protease activity HflC (stomatin/prohibitin superfamily)